MLESLTSWRILVHREERGLRVHDLGLLPVETFMLLDRGLLVEGGLLAPIIQRALLVQARLKEGGLAWLE